MIVRITGIIAEIAEGSVVVEQGGIAREVLVPHYAVGELAAFHGRSVTLHTLEFFEGNQASGNLVPRMLGFTRVEDREFFQQFVNVKGIGPRKALKALAEPAGRIAAWIESGDAKALSRLPGIGQRGAELIVASLKGKLSSLAATAAVSMPRESVALSRPQKDALEILVAWGDGRGEAERWLDQAAKSNGKIDSADEWVRAAYRIKAGG